MSTVCATSGNGPGQDQRKPSSLMRRRDSERAKSSSMQFMIIGPTLGKIRQRWTRSGGPAASSYPQESTWGQMRKCGSWKACRIRCSGRTCISRRLRLGTITSTPSGGCPTVCFSMASRCRPLPRSWPIGTRLTAPSGSTIRSTSAPSRASRQAISCPESSEAISCGARLWLSAQRRSSLAINTGSPGGAAWEVPMLRYSARKP